MSRITFHTAIKNDPVWVWISHENKWIPGAVAGFTPKHARVLLEGRAPARLIKVLWDAVRRRDPNLEGSADRPDIADAVEKAVGPARDSLDATRRGARRAALKV